MVHTLSIKSTVALLLATASVAHAQNATSTSSGVPAQVSPAWLSHVVPLSGNVNAYPSGANATVPTGPLTEISFNTSAYPEGWKSPSTSSSEVKAVIKALDWTMVPASSIRKANSNGDLSMSGYNDSTDPDCWWSATGCVKSKNSTIPPDVAACPQVGDWGLTYDDGPLTEGDAGTWAEPHLYDFLASQNQKAGLFYIGSNVIAAPAAAQRALADGHTLCVHTWSHPAMTSLTNEAVVAELYWTMRAIKEVTGVTTKCWRPPYGDVDDRVRAIAWQMGLTTVLWDEDTDDWNMPGEGGGNLSPETVDGYFENWIAARKNGTDNKTGHIVLQHELNNATVSMAEKWLPEIKQTFNVVPWNQCFNVSHPYWETNFVYPIADGSIPSNNTISAAGNVTNATTTSSSSSSSASSAQDTTTDSSDAKNVNAGVSTSGASSLSSVSVSAAALMGVMAITAFSI